MCMTITFIYTFTEAEALAIHIHSVHMLTHNNYIIVIIEVTLP